MTQEEKDLLFKDLSARLPYGVKVQFKLPDYTDKVFTEEIGEVQSIGKYRGISVNSKGIDYRLMKLDCKPYLRPLSSMTGEEIKATNKMTMMQIFDYYNSIYVDYRGLISKGIALEAPEDMYK